MICAIQTYPGANRDLMVHWSGFRTLAQFSPIVIVGTVGGGCWVPNGALYVEIGANRHVAGDHLPRRLVDTAAHLLTIPGWEWGACAEYDVAFFRPFPELAKGFHGHLAGGQLPGCKSTFFYHFPMVADRETWERFVVGGRELLAAGETEGGTPDAFAALVLERYSIPHHFNSFKSYSRNTVHFSFRPGESDFSLEARQAVRDGCVSVHGLKTSKTYKTDAAEMLKFISS